MRILFVNATNPNDFAHTCPLSVAYLAGYLRNNSKVKGIYAQSFSSPDMEKLRFIVKEWHPDIVAITATSVTYASAIAVTKLVKQLKNDVKVVVGGQHISLEPESLSREMDVGVIGEGELTFAEIVEAVAARKKDYKQIKGICYYEDGRLHKTQERDFVKDLDSVGYPERRLLDSVNNILFSSRGCPYECVFCSSAQLWKRTIRFHSAEYVFNEIRNLYERGFSIQWFADDLFVCNKDRIRHLLALMKEHRLHRKILFFAEGRSNLIDDEIAALVAELGVYRISFGFESGDDKVLSYAKGKSVSVQTHKRAAEICRRNGIFVDGYFMAGFPIDTPDSLQRTYEFAAECCDFLGEPNLVMVFPGTKLRQMLLEQRGSDYAKIHLSKFQCNSYLPLDDETIVCENLSIDEIKRFQASFRELREKLLRRFYRSYFNRLVFSRSVLMNLTYVLGKVWLRLVNPKRKFISGVVRLN